MKGKPIAPGVVDGDDSGELARVREESRREGAIARRSAKKLLFFFALSFAPSRSYFVLRAAKILDQVAGLIDRLRIDEPRRDVAASRGDVF